MATQAQNKASAKYNRENTTLVTIRLMNRNEQDMKILEHLRQQGNKSGYIKTLILKDMGSH